jgi:hypothetical protein
MHRWFTAMLKGRWCANLDEALFDALRAGQARTGSGPDEVVLNPLTLIEESEPRARNVFQQ